MENNKKGLNKDIHNKLCEQEYRFAKNYDNLPFPKLVEEFSAYYSKQKPIKHHKVDKFSDDMQRELNNNSSKGDWQQFLDKDEIMSELYYHLGKLEDSIIDKESNKIKEHIADCANILMFLGNAYNLYDE